MTPDHWNEPELAERCQRHDGKAQQALYALYADRMFRTGFRYIHSTVDVEDVLIVAFTKVFKNIGSFHFTGTGSLEAWVRKIVVNESLMWLRNRHNFNLTESLDDGMPEPDLRALSDVSAEDIYNLIVQLPTGYRTVFNLNVIEGYHHREIAGLLGISEGTSRSQLFKAKEILKKILTREGFNYGT